MVSGALQFKEEDNSHKKHHIRKNYTNSWHSVKNIYNRRNNIKHWEGSDMHLRNYITFSYILSQNTNLSVKTTLAFICQNQSKYVELSI